MTERKPPLFPFVERDPESPEVFFIDHQELSGRKRFRCKRPTFGTRLRLEETKSRLLNSPNPTEEGDLLADYAATILVGLESSPFTPQDDKDAELTVDEVIDPALVQAVWSEVMAYWATFRS